MTKGTCEIANINSYSQVVVSGTEEGVNECLQQLKKANLATKAINLQVSAPFHSSIVKDGSFFTYSLF